MIEISRHIHDGSELDASELERSELKILEAKNTSQTVSPINSTDSFDWSAEEYQNFSREIQLLKHEYHKSELFSNESLIKLLDNYPRTWLQCYTMGTNPENHNEWTPVHIAESSGIEIMEALQKGRIWINAVNIDKYDKHYGKLIEEMYTKISSNCPHIHKLRNAFNALLISSPGIQVYYHLDTDPNMLWHIRGVKKFWVYPARDKRFTPQNYIEEIIAHERHENMPYQSWYDDHAYAISLKEGQAVSWPQHSPHRVENVTVNVSLTSSYESTESRRLVGVHGANYYFLRKLGIKNRPTNTEGLLPAFKSFSYYVCNKLSLLKKGSRTSTYVSNIRVDPKSETGLSTMDNASRTAFSYIDE
ncbi:hypothetical protein GCM10009133_06650 [Cocleimonas flava]|uniref:JmjC domain-containing protein n=1 Tax=Cocleimonas flava TaxID=634765 RepID=A0A4R1EZV0_9GAMM|nr:hypothetical protein [Cocleimonas flava]TCJ87033.1 hypothetical protein EV695_1534 [Cocleimonas flava]